MTADATVVLDVDRTTVLRRRVRLLVGAVIVYNVLEAVTAIIAGAVASSTALVGFGLDSIVEVTSALAITWQYAHHTPSDREDRALRVVAYSFFALAAYVSVDAVLSLTGERDAVHSSLGIGLAALSLIVMPIASVVERRIGEELGSASVVADSKQLLLCSYLSAVLLVGLVINSTVGWSWADPVAGLVIAGLAIREGRNALRGDVCCAPPTALLSESVDECCP
ncbi:MAG: cation transporter [Ilumatobacter sp.]|uniref:cation transporter n=1 Tax=Ilumatobacter sp. TaxID=1967498 RepID=UPI003C71DCB3